MNLEPTSASDDEPVRARRAGGAVVDGLGD